MYIVVVGNEYARQTLKLTETSYNLMLASKIDEVTNLCNDAEQIRVMKINSTVDKLLVKNRRNLVGEAIGLKIEFLAAGFVHPDKGTPKQKQSPIYSNFYEKTFLWLDDEDREEISSTFFSHPKDVDALNVFHTDQLGSAATVEEVAQKFEMPLDQITFVIVDAK